jgi:hypothetical protein
MGLILNSSCELFLTPPLLYISFGTEAYSFYDCFLTGANVDFLFTIEIGTISSRSAEREL